VRAGWRSDRNGLRRRDALRLGAIAALAVPLAACGEGYDDSPDPLSALADDASADAKAARAITGSGAALAATVARVRAEHARALRREVVRANRPPAKDTPEGKPVTDLASLGTRLTTARERTRAMVPTAPGYRAGLLGAVAAGCASVQALDVTLGKVAEPAFEQPGQVGKPAGAAVGALQRALAAEHAAIWVYDLVTAFLSAAYDEAIEAAVEEHQARRDATEQVLTNAGVSPVPPESAYRTPKPVTGEESAVAVVVVAETDATAAWRGVLERTADPALRRYALDALQASAVHATHWRAEAGISPAVVALPGMTA